MTASRSLTTVGSRISAVSTTICSSCLSGAAPPTLGRIAGALLSDKALSKILTPSALGDEFEAIDDAIVEKLDEKAGDIIRWGHQIGWFSEDEEQYDDWKDRIGSVRSLCLKKVGELTNSDDIEARTELFRDLHGLIASATQLYYAIGVDVTINIRNAGYWDVDPG